MAAPMPPAAFVEEMRRRGVSLIADGDTLCVRGPEEARTPKVRDYLRRQKGELLAFLREMEPEYVPDLEAGRADLGRVEAMVAQARACALPPGPVSLGEGRTVADPNAAAPDLWERMRQAKAAERFAEAQALAGDLLTLLDWWEYPGLADTSDLAALWEQGEAMQGTREIRR